MKSRTRWSAVVAALAIASPAGAAHAVTPSTAEPDASIAALPPSVLVAHRGGGLEAQENSLSALQLALDTGVVDVLEMDTRQRKDGTVVLMHDAKVDRTTGATGQVSDLTSAAWAALRLDLGSWLTPRPALEPPPTLAQALDRFGGQSVLSVEAKVASSVDKIIEMVRARGLEDSVYVATNDPEVARHIHSQGMRTHLWRGAAQMRDDDPAPFAAYADVLDIDINADRADFVRFVNSGVERVWAHTLTTRAEAALAVGLGADGIVTDTPQYTTGRTDTYPAVPATLRVHEAPSAAQVSDHAMARVGVVGESGPGIPEAEVSVSGRGVTAVTTSTTATGIKTLRFDTLGAQVGTGPVTLSVQSGSGTERRWSGGTLPLALPLVGEDLHLAPVLQREGLQVTVKVNILDSATPAYRGSRGETGADRTIAGLHRAQLFLTIRRAGKVVHRDDLAGVDIGTGAAATDGEGKTVFRWKAPARGTYDVKVAQRGAVYAFASKTETLSVR